MRHCANHSLSEYLNTNVSTILEETLFLTDLLLTYCMANSRKIQQFNNLYTKYLRKLIYLFTLPLDHDILRTNAWMFDEGRMLNVMLTFYTGYSIDKSLRALFINYSIWKKSFNVNKKSDWWRKRCHPRRKRRKVWEGSCFLSCMKLNIKVIYILD